MEAPEKIYMRPILTEDGESIMRRCMFQKDEENTIEYVRKEAFIEKVINFLNYKLYDVVATRVPGTIRPHHVAKQELIEDLVKFMKGE